METNHTLPLINRKNSFSKLSWFKIIRPMTFSGTISPILVGTGFAAYYDPVDYRMLTILLIAALLVQISANLFNDYYDFKHGQDQERWTNHKLNEGIQPVHKQLPYVAITSIGIAMILGAWIAAQTTWLIILIGSLSMVCGILYSAGNHSFSALGLGEVIAATFLGFVTTILGFITQGHDLNQSILFIAFSFAMLISTMILTNNIRDIKKDVGFRRTLAMRLGRKHAIRLLTTLLSFIYMWMLILVFLGIVPISVLITYLALPAAFKLRYCFRKGATQAEVTSSMGWAGKHHWTFGILFAIGIWIG